MATSVHIPKPLLEAVDRRARALKVSRNKLIVQALEREVIGGADWPEGFFEKLAKADPELVAAVDEMSKVITVRSHRGHVRAGGMDGRREHGVRRDQGRARA